MRRIMERLALLAAITVVVVPAGTAISSTGGVHTRRLKPSRFSLGPVPASLSLLPGGSATLSVQIKAHGGRVRWIALRVVGLPAKMSARFRPRWVRPGHSSRLILRALASTPPGSYAITVLATGHRSRRGRSRLMRRTAIGAAVVSAATIMVVIATGGSPAGVPSHVPTWAYDDVCSGHGPPTSLVRAWVTYAESNCGLEDSKALGDCHAGGVSYCVAVQYVDANWIYAQGSLPVAAQAQASWWLHDPGFRDPGHRVSVPAYGGGHLLNQDNPAVDAWFQAYVRRHYGSFDALMMDDTSGSLRDTLFGSGLTSTEETSSDAQLQAAHDRMAAAMTHTNGRPFLQIDNGLSPNEYLSTPFSMLSDSTGVKGVITEGDPIDDGTLTTYYPTLLDEMSYIDQTAHDFAVLLSYDQSGSPVARRVQAATVLLGYSGSHIVSWSDLDTNSSDLAVWPEEGIVPSDPVQSMSAPGGPGCLAGQGVVCSAGGHDDLQVAPGVFRREFANCYDQGVGFGPCAAVVNTTGSPVTVQSSWLTETYGHEITLIGGDVESGGRIDLTGATFAAGATSVPAGDALLLAG